MKFRLTAVFLAMAAGAAHATTVRIHYDVGNAAASAAATMTVEAEKGPAHAARRDPASQPGDPVWIYRWPDAQGDITMKPRFNNAPSTGGSYRLPAGATVDIYPFFGPARGTVEIMPEVASPQLHNSRHLRIYYPPSYRENPAKRYPVLYMHDGQNLFDAKTAAFGVAWEMAATIDKLIETGRMQEIVVVGIDNSAARMEEYTPCCDPKHGGGKLPAYEAFVADTVKPLIDRQVRTLPDRAHTAVMGSSLGGLASIDLARRRPAQFSMAAGLSSSFWWAGRAMVTDAPDKPHPVLPQRYYIDAGTIDDGLADTEAMRDAMLARDYVSGRDLLFYTAPGGRHNEASWGARVDRPLVWFFPWDEGSTD